METNILPATKLKQWRSKVTNINQDLSYKVPIMMIFT